MVVPVTQSVSLWKGRRGKSGRAPGGKSKVCRAIRMGRLPLDDSDKADHKHNGQKLDAHEEEIEEGKQSNYRGQ